MLNKRKGQSTVEYIVLVTAVIGVAIAFLVSPASPFKKKLGDSLNVTTDQVTDLTDRLTNSQKASDSTTSNPAPASFVVDPSKSPFATTSK